MIHNKYPLHCCPECGSVNVEVKEILPSKDAVSRISKVFVCCNDCYNATRRYSRLKDAVDDWNSFCKVQLNWTNYASLNDYCLGSKERSFLRKEINYENH